jgi:hypothetical protein
MQQARDSFAHKVNDWLLVEDKQGNKYPPGGACGKRWKNPDGTELALISQGETFDVFIGRDRFVNVTLPARTAVALAKWLLVWWAVACWFGLKHWLWRWSLSRIYDSWREDDAAPTLPDGLGRPGSGQ